MSSKAIYMVIAAFILGCVFCLGLWWILSRKSKVETMKAIVWFCLCNGCAWVWCSYLLAYLGRSEIAQSLSQVALTEIVAVVLAYAIKSLFENLSKNNVWPDKSNGKDSVTNE